MLSFDKY